MERSNYYERPDEPRPRRRARSASPLGSQVPFEARLFAAATNRETPTPLFEPDRKEPRIRLRILQYMNIIYMKKLLTSEVAHIKPNRAVEHEQMSNIRRLMRDYIGAVRDLQYMLEPTSRFSRTDKVLRGLFYITRDPDSAILESEGILANRWLDRETFDVIVPEYAGYGGYYGNLDREHAKAEGFFGRLLAAALSGLALIGPIFIMKLVGGLVVQLVVTSACVLLLGGVLSFLEEMGKKDVVAATAAYAAVLVVFIGTNSS
ncbi:hypothetical protein DL765_011633 [Monosporascus sp. GIB2]|nr:hypothetical protein DL765_011633 [Monosporascus sp. GIB2]